MNTHYGLGIIGLGVMGRNLALNFTRHGFLPIGFDPASRSNSTSGLVVAGSLSEMVGSLDSPRTLLLLVPAGQVVEEVLSSLQSHLQPGDLVIDAGNSHYLDTGRRLLQLKKHGLHFIGLGISGGASGALWGPSLMPGGSQEAWPRVSEMFTAIAARAEEDGTACLTWIGPAGSGHFVKMVHNGLEYADMQMLAEVYDLLKRGAGLACQEIAEIFESWNQGKLRSYLLEITAHILHRRDEDTGRPLVELILDEAVQKGTGKWAVQAALDIGAAVPSISAAVESRLLSTSKNQRLIAAEVLGRHRNFEGRVDQLVENLEHALYASKVAAYAQGFVMLKMASQQYDWDLDLHQIVLIWRAGCIIRASILGVIASALQRNPAQTNLLLDPEFTAFVLEYQDSWRTVVKTAFDLGIPMPAVASALSYFDTLRSETLPANLVQAQRDYFGAHSYQRLDRAGNFHAPWDQD